MKHTEHTHKLFVLILYWFLQFTIILAQKPADLTISFTEIQKGTTTIEQSNWENISLEKGETLYIGFAASEPAFFRVFLDGVMIEPKLIESYYTLKDLTGGTHIFKVLAYNNELVKSAPLLLTFSVTEEKMIVTEKKAETNEPFLNNQVFVNGLALLCAVLFVVVLVLIFKKNPKEASASNKLVEELSDLKYSFKRVKEELAQHLEENENLKARIQELDYNVKTLENANVHLVEQKEKLAASKTKLEILHKQKEEMFAIAIHDIKNPASAIRGYIELLNSYELNANEQQEIMASLVASSEDIVKLSQEMCVIIAKAMPEPKLKLQTASLKNLVDDVCNQNASYAKAKKVKFFNKNANELPDVKMDPEKIEEALDNLVNNAIKYAPPETTVEVRSYVKDLNKKLV
ncbi:MAG: HAMP domain-containing sensor histidine kinase, partial [Bacteroidota bacterium]